MENHVFLFVKYLIKNVMKRQNVLGSIFPQILDLPLDYFIEIPPATCELGFKTCHPYLVPV